LQAAASARQAGKEPQDGEFSPAQFRGIAKIPSQHGGHALTESF